MNLTFLVASFIFLITPGLATMYILNNSAVFGKKSGIYAALGVLTGGMIYNIIASVGLASLLYRYPTVLNTIKIIGAIYLIYVGIIGLIKNNNSNNREKSATRQSYTRGIITNLANPKVLLFFMTFIPQFVKENDNFVKEMFLLGSTYLL